MTENEGKIDSVQSYDSEIITAGAMQKTINISNSGELPIQVKKFKDQYPTLYSDLFESHGWHLDLTTPQPKMFYQHADWNEGARLEGAALKISLREDCNENTYGRKIYCLPVSSLSCAISTPEYITIQIMDFVTRLRTALSIKPQGYSFTAREVFKSRLGKALVLDQHINRPGHVSDDLKSTLDRYFSSNPNVSKNIATWRESHATHESLIIDDYGRNRNMTDAVGRYEKLSHKL